MLLLVFDIVATVGVAVVASFGVGGCANTGVAIGATLSVVLVMLYFFFFLSISGSVAGCAIVSVAVGDTVGVGATFGNNFDATVVIAVGASFDVSVAANANVCFVFGVSTYIYIFHK